MREHFEAVEADFQSHYGIDLRDALWGPRPIGVRRLLSLINGLPIRGAMHREISSDGRDWSSIEELLATVIELLDFGNRMRFAASVKQGTEIWEPIEVRRPYDKEKPPPEPAKTSVADLLEALGDAAEVAN
jgi:hypothetical protein